MKCRYVFGESTWNIISGGKLCQDSVEVEIAHELQRVLNINIKSCSHCIFDGIYTSVIQILFASDEDKEQLLKMGAKAENNSFDAIVPDERLNKIILKTVDSVLIKNGVCQVPTHRIIHAYSFDQAVVNCFFEEKIDEIHQYCKDEYPDIDFALNFSMSRGVPGYYYILFRNSESLERYTKNGIVDSIIKRVNSYCAGKIPFSSYDHIRVIPFVESLDSLTCDYMGLVENNNKNPLRTL